MPAVCPSARPTTTSYHDMGRLSPYQSKNQLEAMPSPRTATQDINEPFTTPTASKKRRSPNAFILFRSYVIANKLYPSDMKLQNDISRLVADKWRSAPASERAVFSRKTKEEKLQCEIEGPAETQKKKRTRKPRTMKRYEIVPQPDVPFGLTQIPASPSTYASSPSSSEDSASPVPVFYTPTLDFYTPRKTSASPVRTPQSMPLHSPSILGWDLQTESQGSYSEKRVFQTPEWLSPSQESSFFPVCNGVSHNDVAAFESALQLELDFLLSSDMAMSMPMGAYADRASPVFHIPSSKPLPYPFGAYDILLALF